MAALHRLVWEGRQTVRQTVDVNALARESAGMTDVKMWGKDPFWGLGYEFDPQWLLTDEQKKLQKTLIDLCQTSMRENAVESDKKLIYPRKNFQALAKHGFLGLIVPKELGGMGQNHVAAAMAVETIARYGCPDRKSTRLNSSH